MKLLTYLAVEDDDLLDECRYLPVEAINLSSLRGEVLAAARRADVVELIRPDAREYLQNTYLGITK